jgi:hypothetical protein
MSEEATLHRFQVVDPAASRAGQQERQKLRRQAQRVLLAKERKEREQEARDTTVRLKQEECKQERLNQEKEAANKKQEKQEQIQRWTSLHQNHH